MTECTDAAYDFLAGLKPNVERTRIKQCLMKSRTGGDVTKGSYLGEFELVVLLALARFDDPTSGMPVYDEIRRVTGRDLSVHSVYVTLSRMEKKGYVSSVGESAPESRVAGKARKCYALSSEGVAAIQQSRAMYDSLWAGVRLSADARKS